MVAKINSSKSIGSILNYNENKVKSGNAELILASKFICDVDQLSFKEKLNRFNYLNENNKKVKTNTVHISLNFDSSENISLDKLQDIAVAYMDKIGFGEQPFLAYQHFDAAHPHIHLVTSNIQADGKRIDLHNIGRNQSETARKEIEKDFGLVQAENRKKEKQLINPANLEKALYGKTETKHAVSNVIGAVVNSYKYTSLAELNAVLKQFNVIADRGEEGSYLYERRGLQYRLLDGQGKKIGVPIKASSIYCRPTLDSIEKKFQLNELLRKPHKQRVKDIIDKVWNRNNNTISKSGFEKILGKWNVNVAFRENEAGRIYGITFVDNQTKAVFNGSDLGKEYSAKAIVERFVPATEVQKKSENSHGTLQPTSLETPNGPYQNILDQLMKSEGSFEGLPSELKKKRKKKRNRPNL